MDIIWCYEPIMMLIALYLHIYVHHTTILYHRQAHDGQIAIKWNDVRVFHELRWINIVLPSLLDMALPISNKRHVKKLLAGSLP